jgi:hypothetical protein
MAGFDDTASHRRTLAPEADEPDAHHEANSCSGSVTTACGPG